MISSKQEYWLPTYRPTAVQTVISSKLFSPTEYQSTQKLLDDARADNCGGAGGTGKMSAQQEEDGTPLSRVRMKVFIQNKSLWKSFMKIGNEMIVTKPGRCLFPNLLVSLHGLEHKKRYQVSLRMVPVDNYRYRYSNTNWSPAGESDIIQNHQRQTFHHPCSPTSGQFWMKRPISFKSVKITHYSNSKNGNILLHTMHKYAMEVTVTPQDGSPPTSMHLPETTFIAVSAYQNSEVIQLKIDNNPFAKAFKYQDKAAILEHFSEASSPKGTVPKQVDRQLGPVPYLPQFSNTAQTSSVASVYPLLPSGPPTSPGLQATPFLSQPTSETLRNAGAHQFYPLLPSQMQAGYFPLPSPLMSPYLLLMLCNQMYYNTSKQTHINAGKATGIDEPSNLMKNDNGVLLL